MNEYQPNCWFLMNWFWALSANEMLKIARLKPCLRHFIAHAPNTRQYLQNEWKTINRYTNESKLQVYTNYTYLHTKLGFIQRNLYKRIDKCHKSIVKITTFWHLTASPTSSPHRRAHTSRANPTLGENYFRLLDVFLNSRAYAQVEQFPTLSEYNSQKSNKTHW